MLHPNETDERAIEAAEYAAELAVEYERQYALDNLLDGVNILTEFDTSKLTPEQKTKFNKAKEDLAKNCLGEALLSAVGQANVSMGATSAGEYNPVTNTISFRNNNDINATTLGAELMHAYQQQLYGTLSDIANGTRPTGGSNIEFEEKAFNLKSQMLDGGGWFTFKGEELLLDWLIKLEINHPTGPISLSTAELTSWYQAVEAFRQIHIGNPDHYGDPVDPNLKPNAIISLINEVLEKNCN